MPFTLLSVLLTAACCAVGSRYFVHMLQLESYQRPGYRRWMARNRDKVLKKCVVVGIAAVALSWYMPMFLAMFMTEEAARAGSWAGYITMIAFGRRGCDPRNFGFAAARQAPSGDDPAREKAVFDPGTRVPGRSERVRGFADSAISPVCGKPVPGVFGGADRRAVEKRINFTFFDRARKKLESRPELIKIGITGSYGKTSTKFVLRDILSQKYRVLATPASFNTPMGLSRVINEQLKDEHQLFIAEMGARHVGDIRELCELVHPKYGVLTSVGPQHLDTFGSIENIASTKFELIESLPQDGVAFFASDGSYVDRLYTKCEREKYRVGYVADRNPYILIKDVEAGPQGSRFTLECADGTHVRCRTQLLGRHNIGNIALSAAVARRLGMTLDEIARGIRRLEPVEHRLQLISGPMTVIDDAFN